jgi:hypothetical protein
VNTVNPDSIVVNSAVTLFSSDEIWVEGTYNGEKQYRWYNGGSVASGKDIRKYDTFKLSGGDEDEITLFEAIGDILILGNSKTLATWDDYKLKNIDLGVGCVSPKGYVKNLGTLYFLDYKGIFATNGGAPVFVSRKVQRYVDGATKAGLEASDAGYKGLSIFFTIGDVTLYKPDGSTWKTLPDVCLEYSVVDQNWYVHTNVPANHLMNFINSSGSERLLMAHTGTDCEVKEFLSGNDDDGDEIFFRADTNDIQLMDDFEKYAHPLRVATEFGRGTLSTTMVSLDGDEFYELEGTNKKGISQLKVTPRDPLEMEPPICRKIKVSFRDNSTQRCRLNQVAIIFEPTSISNDEE